VSDDRFVGEVHQHAVLFDEDGEVLLVQRDDEAWTLPGGPMAAGADAELDFWEPIADQIGVEVRVVMPVWTGADPGEEEAIVGSDGDRERFVTLYLCEPLADIDVDPGAGIRNYGWFPPETVDEEFVEDAALRDGLRKAVALRETMKR